MEVLRHLTYISNYLRVLTQWKWKFGSGRQAMLREVRGASSNIWQKTKDFSGMEMELRRSPSPGDAACLEYMTEIKGF